MIEKIMIHLSHYAKLQKLLIIYSYILQNVETISKLVKKEKKQSC